MNSSIKKGDKLQRNSQLQMYLNKKNLIVYKCLSGYSIYTYFFTTIILRNF